MSDVEQDASVGMRTLRGQVAGIAGAAVALAVALVPILMIASTIRFGTPAFWGMPDRIDYCGRRYYAGGDVTGRPSTFVALVSPPVRWKRVGRTFAGRSIYGTVGHHPNTAVCTVVLYIPRGSHGYRTFALSGGP
jgi:hypothetical protein